MVNQQSQPAGLVAETRIDGLELIRRGKVRDVYAVDADHLLIVATDRVSAFDVVLDPPIPDKGRMLTALSLMWIRYLEMLEDTSIGGLRNHLVSWEAEHWPAAAQAQANQLLGRSMLVQRAEVMPVECIVRGYMAGSVWQGYQKDGLVAGIPAPKGMVLGGRFPEPMFTPTTKAEVGHDEPISYAEVENIIGADRAQAVRQLSVDIYKAGAELAESKGVILCDTKFEFGITSAGELMLIDEVLTPDSSRYWRQSEYSPGALPPSMDKQVVRDYMVSLDWDKQPPAPPLGTATVDAARAAYRSIFELLVGDGFPDDPAEAMRLADAAGTNAAGRKILNGSHDEAEV